MLQFLEEGARVRAGGVAQFSPRAFFLRGDRFGNFFDVGRFAAFAAIRHGRQERGIGFEHETFERRGGDGVADDLGVLERANAGEADEAAGVEDLAHAGAVFNEAVEDCAKLILVAANDRKRVSERFARVDHAIEVKFAREVELGLEDFALTIFGGGVLLGCAAGFGGKAKIVQAAFADGDDLRMGGKLAKFRDEIGGSVFGVTGMPANGGEDVVVLRGDGDGAMVGLRVGADGDDFCDVRRASAFEDLVDLIGEIFPAEMRVGVVEFHGSNIELEYLTTEDTEDTERKFLLCALCVLCG
jgi:hypothetical protein